MTFQTHFKRNLLLVFVNDGDGQSKTNNNEIDRRACCGKRRSPAALATALISDPGAPCARNSLRFLHGSDGVVCECFEILRVVAGRAAGPTFIINEGTHLLGREESLEGIRLQCRISFGSVNENHDWN